MNPHELLHQKINDLVSQDQLLARILYSFGITFYEYPNQTLDSVCREKGISSEKVVDEFARIKENNLNDDLPLFSYRIDLIIEYLKHAHYLFIKHKLPFINNLVQNFKADHPAYESVEKDLKVLFPLFMEDFIRHIYEEEDSLFRYIHFLEKASRGKYNPSKLYQAMERHFLQQCVADHEVHDEEMAGIRKITKDYWLTPDAPVHVKVIFSELIEFEKNLKEHARIENEILFPKALVLESRVKTAFFEKAKWN
ncbi:MAG: Nitric oxide-dependent regulator DnrN or NorA [Cytophagales bacterium]|jgi:regulator of cell morphogenesis and NO signaling|nr:iron-sulfur cluster repair di-iron protein [Bacteroidota bacterium]MBS1980399.1 iron-sulfur cluster repair di-iron protein [Bacteroidota bacterium]WHZ07713.1 MAG: Nitric oxide-dependent regulator DnrN or NorA [Cytophagales bacterium]